MDMIKRKSTTFHKTFQKNTPTQDGCIGAKIRTCVFLQPQSFQQSVVFASDSLVFRQR